MLDSRKKNWYTITIVNIRGLLTMKCPFCGDQDSKVVDSRHSEDGMSIRRRRECMKCQRRFTTYEIVEGLSEGETVATKGSNSLRSGSKIQIAD